MNFLAHLYLSKNHKDILIGNFIADSIRGNKYDYLPVGVQQGILLHRQIDTYTDVHPVVKRSKRRLHKRYRHYDGVIVDILYDHFLAKNWDNYATTSLKIYTQNIYKLLRANRAILPEATQQFLPFMIQQDWLYNYQFIEGIARTLVGMNRRTHQKSQMHLAINDLREHYNFFQQDFTVFFKELCAFCDEKLEEISSKINE